MPSTSESTQSQVTSQTNQKIDQLKTLLKSILNYGKMKLFPKKTFTIGIFNCLLVVFNYIQLKNVLN